MNNRLSLNEDTITKFNNISAQLYNFKYAFKLFINHLEDNTDIPLEALCLALILRDNFEKVKNDYNILEQDLGILV